LKPIYLSSVIIGEVVDSMQDMVQEDCQRALWGRLRDLHDLPRGYDLHRPDILFTSIAFRHSRESLASSSSCNECIDLASSTLHRRSDPQLFVSALCWLADSTYPHDVLISGIKRGVPPKHRHDPRIRPQCSKICLFQLYRHTLSILGLPSEPDAKTYFDCKQSMTEYQMAKRVLMGETGPFSGWMKRGKQWESFRVNGDCEEPTHPIVKSQ